MHPSTLFVASLPLGLAAAVVEDGSSLSSKTLGRFTHGFIVEYDNPTGDKPDMTSLVANATNSAMDVVQKLTLESSLFTGASYRITRNDGKLTELTIQQLVEQMPNVKAVYPNYRYTAQGVASFRETRVLPVEDDDVDPKSTSATVAVRQSGGGDLVFPDGSSLVNPHALTRVDQAHAAGITGKNLTIALIDTGIDRSHPAFAGKITGGYDLAGDTQAAPFPDADFGSSCNNHGTATASLAAGLPYKLGFVGVAPDAFIHMYKVFTCDNGTTTDLGVAASLDAYEAGVDVISASIGSQGGWGNDLWAITIANIMAKGTLYLTAAGNDGNSGPFWANGVSGTLTAPNVGSVDNAYSPAVIYNGSYSVDGGAAAPIVYSPGFPANWTSPLSVIPLAVNGCAPYPNRTYADNEVIVVPRVPRGVSGCDQDKLIQDAGIKNILQFNDADGFGLRPLPLSTTENFPFAWLTGRGWLDRDTGVALTELIKQGRNVTLDLPWKPSSDDSRELRLVQNAMSGGFVSNYSTWGPTFEAKIDPTFSAPGGNLMAAGGQLYGGLVIASGTSFSCPHAAGVALLVKQMHPTLGPFEIVNRMASTARPMQMQAPETRATLPGLAPAFQQGAGIIDAWAAIYTNTTLSKASLAFNDTAFIQPQDFIITNVGAAEATYDLKHAPAYTVFTFLPGALTVTPFAYSNYTSNVLSEVYASLDISPSTLTLGPGKSATVTVKATPPTGLDSQRVPLYSGFINITSSTGDVLTLPYGGIGAALKDVPVLDTSPSQNTSYLVTSQPNSTDAGVYSAGAAAFNVPRSLDPVVNGNATYPGLHFRTVFGSRLAKPVLYDAAGEDDKELGEIRVAVDPIPSSYVRDDTEEWHWLGQWANGSFVEGGAYRFGLRLLRVRGDPGKLGDYDEVMFPAFNISFYDA